MEDQMNSTTDTMEGVVDVVLPPTVEDTTPTLLDSLNTNLDVVNNTTDDLLPLPSPTTMNDTDPVLDVVEPINDNITPDPTATTTTTESSATPKCFEDRTELKFAVDSCWEGGKGHFSDPDTIIDQTYGATDVLNDANEADCNDVKAKYGWPIGTWCVKDVTDMHFLFNRKETFNEDINSWDTSSVVDMYETFSYAMSFNGNLGDWDVSKVKSMYGMFNGAYKFEGKELSNWKTNSLTDTQWMFYGDEYGNKGYLFDADLSGWDMSKVSNFWEMFAYSRSFKGVGVDKWDTSSGIYMEGMFFDAPVFDADLSGWDVSGIESFRWMFLGAEEFKGEGLDKWQLSSITRSDQMFDGATNFNKNLCTWGEQASFSYNRVDDMFANSGCTYTADPTQANKGPFCASTCGAILDDTVNDTSSASIHSNIGMMGFIIVGYALSVFRG